LEVALKKKFALSVSGLLAVTVLLTAGALLIGRDVEPQDDDAGVERLSTPVSQMGRASTKQAPDSQPEGKLPGAEPLDPPGGLPLTSMDSTKEVDDSGVETQSGPVSQMEGASALQTPDSLPGEKPQMAEPLAPAAGLPLTSLDSTREVEVDFRRFRQLIPRDAINPIYRPRFTSAESAGLNPEELVIGVAINGESRAYPVGPLNRREMVNDMVGGVPILVTW
jgi:hypothetical protein